MLFDNLDEDMEFLDEDMEFKCYSLELLKERLDNLERALYCLEKDPYFSETAFHSISNHQLAEYLVICDGHDDVLTDVNRAVDSKIYDHLNGCSLCYNKALKALICVNVLRRYEIEEKTNEFN